MWLLPIRQPLTVETMRLLLKTTREAETRFGMTGPERALLYQLAAETGLRAGELRSLKRRNFD